MRAKALYSYTRNLRASALGRHKQRKVRCLAWRTGRKRASWEAKSVKKRRMIGAQPKKSEAGQHDRAAAGFSTWPENHEFDRPCPFICRNESELITIDASQAPA